MKYKLIKKFYFPDGSYTESQIMEEDTADFYDYWVNDNRGMKRGISKSFVLSNTEFFERVEDEPIKVPDADFSTPVVSKDIGYDEYDTCPPNSPIKNEFNIEPTSLDSEYEYTKINPDFPNRPPYPDNRIWGTNYPENKIIKVRKSQPTKPEIEEIPWTLPILGYDYPYITDDPNWLDNIEPKEGFRVRVKVTDFEYIEYIAHNGRFWRRSFTSKLERIELLGMEKLIKEWDSDYLSAFIDKLNQISRAVNYLLDKENGK